MKTTLDTEQYNLIKEIDFSELGDKIAFDDNEKSVECDDPELFKIIFLEYIASYGMDSEQNRCTEYGKRLYKLLDYIFYGI